MPYQAGDVLLADLDPVAGHEQGTRRPVLVLSGASYNELRNEQLIVAAVTSRPRGLPFHVPIGSEEACARQAGSSQNRCGPSRWNVSLRNSAGLTRGLWPTPGTG